MECYRRLTMKTIQFIFLSLFLFMAGQQVQAQETIMGLNDSIPATPPIIKPDTARKNTYPRKVALRSAIIPGWGQATNKKYWKIPIVYAALGITSYVFFDNIGVYREYRFAYAARIKAQAPAYDSTDYNTLDQLYKIISPESIRAGRDEFRKYIDYSVLVFVLFWGLNVVDAAVDGHLKSFDISPDLSMKIKPVVNPYLRTAGVGLVFTIGKK
ncbi:MAG: DUF5683 domain-containing protein [Chitinophagaceae bacterium]|nr:DUF5683 domain-containing protein [Chitinophagaceae bacterium]